MTHRHDNGAPLPPPRFSLRTLLLAVTGIGIFFGLFWWLSPLAIAGMVLVALVVAAHVLGNAIGTKLRDGAPRRQAEQSVFEPATSDVAAQIPATSLGERWSLGWSVIAATGVGVAGGMIGGCLWIEHVYHIGFDVYALAFTSVAFGVLGGFAAFSLATFSQTLAVALWQAMRHK
jgi:hypothetical protein